MASDGDGVGCSGGAGGGGGGPAPFLVKTYEMVEDPSSDEIVSWSAAKNSFVVWKPLEFASSLLPTYFKHNNFSSFIRQLNTYGFRKIDPERWEFANDDFVKGQKQLLQNIHRKKPIYSHSHPIGGADSERASLEEMIDRLIREKAALQADLGRFKQHQPGTKLQLGHLDRRLQDMEQRQSNMMEFLFRAVQNPVFVNHLVRMSDAVPLAFSEIHKKRRLPGDGEGADGSPEGPDGSFLEDQHNNMKPEICRLFRHDFSSKLKLELCPAVRENSLLSSSTRSSDEDGFSPPRRLVEGGAQLRQERLFPEAVDSDKGISSCPRKTSTFPWQGRDEEEPGRNLSCHLNLTLASSPLQLDSGLNSNGDLTSASCGAADGIERWKDNTSREGSFGRLPERIQDARAESGTTASTTQEANPSTGQAPVLAAAGRINDKFWEQFLTERPGCSETEEANSGLRACPSAEQQKEKLDGEQSWRGRKEIQQLSL